MAVVSMATYNTYWISTVHIDIKYIAAYNQNILQHLETNER